MQLIDFHTHIYPDAIAHKAAQSVRDFYDIGDAHYDGTVSDLLQSMEITGFRSSPQLCRIALVKASTQTKKDDGASSVSRGDARCADSGL